MSFCHIHMDCSSVKKGILGLILLLAVSVAFSQQIFVKGNVTRLNDRTVFLAKENKDAFAVLDSAQSNGGSFEFLMSQSCELGVYRIYFNKEFEKKYIDKSQYVSFVYEGEDIEFSTMNGKLMDSLVFKLSEENISYLEFLKKEQELVMELSLLHPLVLSYPEASSFCSVVKKQYIEIQKKRNELISSCKKKNPDTYTAKLVSLYWTPLANPNHNEREMLEYKKQHYFDSLDFSDESLLNSSIFSEILIDYLMLYRGVNMSPMQQEYEFIKAVDIILLNTNSNSQVYAFSLDYLVRGFEKFKMENVLNYVYENYLSENSCETDNKEMLKKRLQAYNDLAVGKIAPTLMVNDMNDNVIDIGKLNKKKKYTLIVFWASWCSHCKGFLEQLSDEYTYYQPNVNLITISLDTLKKNWLDDANSFPDKWMNCAELKGWNGKSIIDYNVYATPTVFLLNNQRKILAKPITYLELKKAYSLLEDN